MKPFRVLLLSNARPSRAWKFGLRITNEVKDVCICGIVQRPLRELPWPQQIIAAGHTRAEAPSNVALRARAWVRWVCEELLHLAIWLIHGCPSNRNRPRNFTVAALAESCAERDWPFLEAVSFCDEKVWNFIREKYPDLVIVLGRPSGLPAQAIFSSRGMIRICRRELRNPGASQPNGVELHVEHLEKDAKRGTVIAALGLPWQPEDGTLGFTLKADLLADDLLLQTALSSLRRNGIPAASDVTLWMSEILEPYLEQLSPSTCPQTKPNSRAFTRPFWRLGLETLLFCSPYFLVRNWLRRWNSRCPVLILAYHVVSDRGHRLGISTERFWTQVQFLLRHYHLVSLAEASAFLKTGKVSTPVVSLTFDDGYADNFLSLRAVADELDIPVCLFISTEPVNLHSQFRHDVANGENGALPLTWKQIRYWSRRGAEFGSHTRTHADCGTNDHATLREEILGAKYELEHRLRKPVPFLAFPFGKPENISEPAVAVARTAHRHFLSFYGGENLIRDGENNFNLLRKIPYPEPWELEMELQSVFDFAGALKRKTSLGGARITSLPARPSVSSHASGTGHAFPLPAGQAADGSGPALHEGTTALK